MMRIALVAAPAAIAHRNDARFPAADDALDAAARAELATVSLVVASETLVVASPSPNARETALLCGGDAVVDDALADCDYGRWSGRTLAAIAASEPNAIAAWLRDPHAAPHGGESVAALVARAERWLHGLDIRHDVLAFTHPAVVRAVVVTVLGASLDVFGRIDVEPSRRAQCTFDGRRFALRSLNERL